MKNLFITLTLLLGISFSASAQYDYPEWGIGASIGTARPYSDVRQNDIQRRYSLSLHWNYSPYLPFTFEAQTGKLTGGSIITDPYKRQFVNDYLAFDLHADVQLGELTDFEGRFLLERLKGLYLGTGVGVMFNNLTFVQRTAVSDPTYVFPGQDKTTTLLVPIRFGYEFKIYNYYDMPIIGVNFNYSHYLTFADGIDGYDDPNSQFKNNAQDMFASFNIGIKINFGGSRQYFKPIRGSR